MKNFSFIILIAIALTSCNRHKDFNHTQTLDHLADKDTLVIKACIHHLCGGEWGGCLEWSKIYREENNYVLQFTEGLEVWNADTLVDPKNTKTSTKLLTTAEIQSVNDFLHQVTLFSDSLSITSNGPDDYVIKTKDYKKTIIKDYDRWPFYQRLRDQLHK